jgi:hypothetical protein
VELWCGAAGLGVFWTPMPTLCPACGKELEGDSAVCGCRSEALAPAEASASAPAASPAPNLNLGIPTFTVDHGLEGIRGWLILVAIGLIVNPFLLLLAASTDIRILGGPNHAVINARLPGVMPLISLELFANAVLFAGTIVLAVLFFRENRRFPRLYQFWLGFSFVAKLAEYTFALQLAPQADWPEAGTVIQSTQSKLAFDTLRAAIAAMVWIAYFQVSRRAKATFVR